LEIIQMLLNDNGTSKETILEKNDYGKLPIHLACSTGAGAPLEVVQLLLDSDTEKKTILENKDG
jgi:hypothetical protein